MAEDMKTGWWQPMRRQTSQGRSSRTERARQVCTYQLTPCRDKLEDGPEQTDSRPRLYRSAFGGLESYLGDMDIAWYRIQSCIVGRVKVAASMRWRLVFVSGIGRLSRRVVKTLRSHGTGQDRRRQASPRRWQRKSQTGSQGGIRCDQDQDSKLPGRGVAYVEVRYCK